MIVCTCDYQVTSRSWICTMEHFIEKHMVGLLLIVLERFNNCRIFECDSPSVRTLVVLREGHVPFATFDL